MISCIWVVVFGCEMYGIVWYLYFWYDIKKFLNFIWFGGFVVGNLFIKRNFEIIFFRIFIVIIIGFL